MNILLHWANILKLVRITTTHIHGLCCPKYFQLTKKTFKYWLEFAIFFKPYGLDPELQALDNNLKIFFYLNTADSGGQNQLLAARLIDYF